VLNVLDVAARRPIPGLSAYCASKAALRAATFALAAELAPRVRVNAVSPGTVLPPESLDEAQRTLIQASIPLGRFGAPEDVARTCVFLARSPWITGQDWAVDGGRSLAPLEVG
jgi:pteridine reductase